MNKNNSEIYTALARTSTDALNVVNKAIDMVENQIDDAHKSVLEALEETKTTTATV